MMRTSTLILFALLLASQGCRTFSGRPDPSWSADFDRAEALSICSLDGTLDVSEPETIERFSEIYANAKWKYGWHTIAVYPDDSLALLRADGTALRTFRYNDVLWELDDRNGVRTAELSDADRTWIDSLFARLPKPDAPDGG